MEQQVVSTPIPVREFLEDKIVSATAHFESRVNNLEKHLKVQDEMRETARKLALNELERRLNDLNHAHQRAADVLQTYLTRDIFDKFREEDINWKRQDEVMRATWVTQEEFRTYKETTQQALTLTAGKSAGVSSVWAMVIVAFSIMAAVGTIGNAIIAYIRLH